VIGRKLRRKRSTTSVGRHETGEESTMQWEKEEKELNNLSRSPPVNDKDNVGMNFSSVPSPRRKKKGEKGSAPLDANIKGN